MPTATGSPRPVRRSRRRSSSPSAPPTSSSSAAATPASGPLGTSSACSRRRASSCSRPRAAERARAAATAASSTVSGSACRRCESTSATVAAIEVARAAAESVAEIGSFCREQEIDAWYRPAGYLQVSTAPAWDDAWGPAERSCHELGEPDACVTLDADEVRRRCASPIFRGAAFYAGGATVQPARLARGLAQRVRDHGVEVFERTKVGSVHRHGHDVVAEAKHGKVRAKAAVVATGGALAHLPTMHRRLTVTSSHIVITEPVPDVLEEIGWTGGECITDSRAMIHYFRTTPDGRIAFGWGGGRLAFGARTHGHAERDPGVSRRGPAPPPPLLPRARGQADHPRLGRADRRLAQPPAGDLRARARYPLRLRLHRPRGRPLAHARPLAGGACARAPRRGQPPGVRQPAAVAGTSGTVSLHRRNDHPARDPAQGDGARAGPQSRAD